MMNLVEENIELAQKIASMVFRRMRGRNTSYGAVLSNAYLGLFRAAKQYDANKGTEFSKFASNHIFGETIDSTRLELGREGSYKARGRKRTASIQDDSYNFEQLAQQPQSETIGEDAITLLFNALTSRQRQVIKLLFFENMTQKEAGEVIGISDSRVAQIKAVALEEMRIAAIGKDLR